MQSDKYPRAAAYLVAVIVAASFAGFLLRMLEPEEIQQRFGADTMGFYAYNVVTSMLSVLFSDPDGGIFETGRAWLQGDVPPRLSLAVLSSVMTTGLIAWVAVTRLRLRGQVRDDRDRLLLIFAAVLIANAVLSLRRDALEMRATNPNLLPRWADR